MTLYQYSGSGSLTNSFGSDRNRSYDYNLSSISENNFEDYQSITNTFNSSDNYGEVTQLSGQTIDYQLVIQTVVSTITPFGSLTFSGSAITQSNYRLYFSGASTEKVIYSPDNTSGTLFSFGNKVEKRTYDYNESSVENTEEDFGFVNQITAQEEDYQLISSPPGITLEYGLITESSGGTLVPFGSLTFSGSAITQSNYRLYFSGASTEKVIYSPDNTSGTLFSFGEKIESVTFDYNETSLYANSDDYQFINALHSESEDYGLITGATGTQPEQNYGLITESVLSGSITPFGSLAFDGSALTSVEATYTHGGSGTLTLSGTLIEKFTEDTLDNTQLFQIFGTTLDSSISSYVGIGTLLNFGTKIEKVTYDYNESSILLYNTLDYQFISTLPNEINDDYGSIIIPASISEDYGVIVGFGATETLYPFGSVFISGVSVEKFIGNTTENTQLFQTSGTALESETDVYNGFETITISGTSLERDSEVYIGSGTIFMDAVGVTTSSLVAKTISYIGSGLITLSGTALESFSAQTPEDIQLFQISGSLVEKEVDSYVGLGTIFLSASLIEKEVDSYVGLGTIFLSAALVEKEVDSYIGSGLITLSGIATEKFTADTPDNTQLFQISGSLVEKEVDSYVGLGTLTVSGELVHPNIDYTPHYGIEQNIGIGTTGIQIYGSVNDSAQRTSRGVGSIFINGLGIESRTIFIPVSGIGTGFIGGEIKISSGIALTHYYSPIYPKNAGIPGSGIGTIRLNDDRGLTITRAVLPYFGRGTIVLSGIGAESFSITNYNGSGLINVSGISSNREIAVYQDYVTGGVITISQQTTPIIVIEVDSYVGSGSIILSGTSVNKKVDSYSGRGTILISSGANESFSAQTPENTQLFTISGFSSEFYSAQTPETEVLYQFNGSLTESITYGYLGTGQLTFASSANTFYKPSISGTGLFRFATHLSDNLYDTCDSTNVTSDYLNSASVKFVANPVENTILYNFYGSGVTRQIQVYTHTGFGSVGISGSHLIRKGKSIVGIGTFNLQSTATKKDINSYIGSGSIDIISGGSESKVSNIPQSTILFNISGTSSTRVVKVKTYSGIGTVYFNGLASTQILSIPSYSGSGVIYLSGELIHPDVQYVPAPKGSGSINLIGSGLEKVGYNYEPVVQPLFFFSGGFESFTETTYIGIGTIYIQSISASSINNPYQIPRLYVTII